MEIAILVALLVLLVSAGVVLVSRRRAGRDYLPPGDGAPSGTLAPPVPEPSLDLEVAPPDVAVPDAQAPPIDVVAPPVEVEPEPVPAEPEPVVEPEPLVRPRFRDRLTRARSALAGYVGGFRGRTIDRDVWDELEEALIAADVGLDTATDLLDHLQRVVKEKGLTSGDDLLVELRALLTARLEGHDRTLHLEPGATNVWLVVGVNGVGKTTTIGKLGQLYGAEGHKVMMAAGDTFRAAAGEQLQMWAERVGADIVRGAEGGDPAAVIFDAIASAGSKGHDLVLADTAGRLHTKTNLMEELRKIRRIAEREPGKVTEVLLVIDATTGQNGLVQAKQFTDAVDVTGVVLTKLDGSAKGGIVVAIQTELGLPIKLVGLGETAADLVPFEPAEFVDALFAP